MATSRYSTIARRQGAKAGVAALVALENAIEQSPGGGYHTIDPTEAARLMVEGAGEKLTPRMEGFLAALGEYLAQALDGSLPAPASFRPLAAMTEEEVAAERADWNLYMTVTAHLRPSDLRRE